MRLYICLLAPSRNLDLKLDFATLARAMSSMAARSEDHGFLLTMFGSGSHEPPPPSVPTLCSSASPTMSSFVKISLAI